jgi:ABC-type sugar transport system substrate-binding protein
MRSPRLAAVVAALGLLGVVPATQATATPEPVAHAAKSCSSGWTHAVVNGAHKCLRRGQFCAHAADSQYHRYGFHCHEQDSRGNYHLT